MLVRQRAESGLLAKMWELPHVLAPQLEGDARLLNRAAARGRKAAPAGMSATMIDEHSGGLQAVHAAQSDVLCRGLSAEDGVLVRPARWWGEAEHVFSHIVWDLQVFKSEFGFYDAFSFYPL